MRSIFLKFSITFCFIVLFCGISFATHNRAGEITYLHKGTEGYVYTFTITTYTDPSSPADRDALVIYWGTFSSPGVPEFDTLIRDSEEILTPSIKKNTYTMDHDFRSPGVYKVYMQDPNRVEDILNIEGSVNVPFYLEDIVYIIDPLKYGYSNSSPQLTNPPIDYANVGEIFTHNPGAYDPDGDAIRYSLIPPRQDPLNDVPGYTYPDEYTGCDDTFTIDSLTGDIVWNVPCDPGIFVVAIHIVELRDGDTIGIINRDMQIEVLDNPNHAPVISELHDTCVYAGDDLILTVTASDPDSTQKLTLTAVGGPFIVESSPADFDPVTSVSPVSGTFEWQTNCDHVQGEFYNVIFKVEDDFFFEGQPEHLADQESWMIYVIAPPVQNVLALAQANEIRVTWDEPYTCASTEKFLGFSIWRKIGCDTTIFDICQRGLSGYGYDSIAFVEDAYQYIDNSVDHGQVYSYRVVAEFGTRSEAVPTNIYNKAQSAPSDNSCAELKRDIPIINHVSVTATDVSAGNIYIQWYPPLADDLDTIENPAPYQYILKRFEGKDAAGTATEIAVFTAESFTALLEDTVFTDTGLNTQDKQYSYLIDFSTANGLVGDGEPASSVYLNSLPADNKSLLSWTFNVPWSNFYYIVQKEIPTGSGIFTTIDTVTTLSYTDDSLANGVEVCYLLEAHGNFTGESLPSDTLINFSEVHCETPVDNEPPCAPVLSVSNICSTDEIITDISQLKNDLTWTNPNNSCADDVIEYDIYYASNNTGQLVLLDKVMDGSDTTYTHKDITSLAGCYYVVAVDSFNNASAPSNIVCLDNCADYNLPNVFTPNGDGSNDLFIPILPYRFIDHVDMKIYNRWGGLVYTATDPMLNWDGTDINTRKELTEGVYYYVCVLYTVTVSGIEQDPTPLKGYIHLIRSEKAQ